MEPTPATKTVAQIAADYTERLKQAQARRRIALRMHTVEKKTFAEIGILLGVSRQRAQAMVKRAQAEKK